MPKQRKNSNNSDKISKEEHPKLESTIETTENTS